MVVSLGKQQGRPKITPEYPAPGGPARIFGVLRRPIRFCPLF